MSGGWFYRGARKPMAHWFDSGEDGPLCGRLKPRPDGFAWRHPSHDRHVPFCGHCEALLAARKALLGGVDQESGPEEG